MSLEWFENWDKESELFQRTGLLCFEKEQEQAECRMDDHDYWTGRDLI